ncbi:MAG: phage gp6-like head-tail connector protein [Alphaproteobacteria bacterium]|nr:MAG: phage gp6-like head-tail connector protein [Alphaproteobacteria bacterium]
MTIDVIEDSPYLAVSVQEMKQFLNLQDDMFNESIINYIKLATRFVERTLGKSFLLKTYKYVWKQPSEASIYQAVKMPMTPVKTVDKLTDLTMNNRIRRYTIEMERYICINDLYYHVEFIYKAGMAEKPEDLDTEYRNLICMVAQAFFEDKDIANHPSMELLKCYKENLSI